MPVDEFGNRADMVMDVRSTPARLNGGRLYETYIKASMLKVERLIKEKMYEEDYKDIHNVPNELIKELFSLPMEFTRLLENELYKTYHGVYTSNDYDTMRMVVTSIIENHFRIKLEVGELKKTYLLTFDIEFSKFRPDKSKVTYISNGETIVSDTEILISPMYIILLSKIADSLLTTASASVNHYGLPVVVNKNDRHNMPHKNNPIRALGETEKRIFVNEGGREFAAELSDMNASIKTHALVYTGILTSEIPTNIPKIVNRKIHPFGSDRGLEVLTTLNKSVGMEIKHIKDKDRYIDVDNIENINMLELGKQEDMEEN